MNHQGQEGVNLNGDEMLAAATHACLRRITALGKGRQQTYGKPTVEPWGMEVEACAAELLVAKTLGVYWHLTTEAFHDLPGDCGNVQVRHTMREDGRLILHEHDPDGARFVLVVGAYPNQRIVGWIYARDGKSQSFWWDGTGRPAYFVPKEYLRPMSDWQV